MRERRQRCGKLWPNTWDPVVEFHQCELPWAHDGWCVCECAIMDEMGRHPHPLPPYRWRRREQATQALGLAGLVWLLRRFRP